MTFPSETSPRRVFLYPQLSPRKLVGRVFAHRDRIAGGFEQVLSSAVSMIGLIVLSRAMSIDDFGILATATGIWLILEMLHHSMVVSPFVLSCPSPADDRAEFGTWILWNALLSAGVGALFLASGALLAKVTPDFGLAVMLAAPMTVAGMLYMFSRRVHYHEANRRSLLIQTITYGASYGLALLAFVWSGTAIGPWEGAAILSLAYGIPAAIYAVRAVRRAEFDGKFMLRVKRSRALITELGAAGAVWQFSYSGTLIALSILAGPASVAVFSITRTLVRPITLLMSTLSDVEFSRGVRADAAEGKEGLARVVRSVSFALVLLNIVPMALLLVFPGFFLSLVYGQQYAHATLELQLRVLLFLPLICVAPLDLALTVRRDTRYLIMAHFVSFLAGVVFLATCYALGRLDAASALASLIVARLVSIPLLYFRYVRVMAPDRAGAPMDTARGD